MKICGVDEAGRGPILGPLVIAAISFKEENIHKLEWLGVKDSKLLSAEVREELFGRIYELVDDFRVEMIEPDAIDLSVQEQNLNWLEADTCARMVSEMDAQRIVVDCPSPNIEAYTAYFIKRLHPQLQEMVRMGTVKLILEHKADVNHIVVGAASIVAKVIRDRQVEKIKREINIDFGSGYLSDAKTQDFLHKYHQQYPGLFRRSWQPYKDLMVKKEQKKLGEY